MNLKQLVIMGGSLRAGGNVTPYAEANFWHDPHAADQVLRAKGASKITIVGLDVTTKISFLPDHYQALENASPKMGSFLNEIGQKYMAFYETVTGAFQAYVHDATAVIAIENPAFFDVENFAISVVTSGERSGEMVASEAASEACQVCTRVQAGAIISQFIKGVGRLD